MSAQTEATGAGGVAQLFAIVLLLLGAFTLRQEVDTTTGHGSGT